MPRGIDAKRHSLLRLIGFSPLGERLEFVSELKRTYKFKRGGKFFSEFYKLRNFREGFNLKRSSRNSNSDRRLYFLKNINYNSDMLHHDKNNKGRLGILAQHEAGFEPSPAFVMLTKVRKRLLPLTKREGSDSVISNNFSDTVFSRFTSHFSRKCTAFTLAEVLITLGIIGIVSALTMPSLVNNFRAKQLENQFKKVDSNLQQAIQKTVTEMGYDKITDFNSGGSDYFATDTHKYISEFTEIFLKQFPEVKEYNCMLYYYKNLPCKKLMGENEQNFTACCSPYTKTYILPNGFLFQEPSAFAGEISIYFDINGPYKGPNRTGHDRFTYSSKAYNNTADTGLYDMCNPNIQNSWHESGCYRYATRNINPLDSSKPYWDVLFKDAKYWKNSSN